MPVVSFDTKADFDAAYDMNAEWDGGYTADRQPVRLGFCRRTMWPLAQRRAQNLVDLFGWPTDTKIVIVGAGYGWTAEALESEHGYTNVACIDTSPWIQANQDTTEETDIDAAITSAGLDPATGEGAVVKGKLFSPGNRRRHSRSIANEDLSNQGSRNRVRSILNGVQVGISENVLSTLEDAEIVDLANRIDQLDTTVEVIHIVTPLLPGSTQDPDYNWKTLADWKALIPSHTFVSTYGYTVL